MTVPGDVIVDICVDIFKVEGQGEAKVGANLVKQLPPLLSNDWKKLCPYT